MNEDRIREIANLASTHAESTVDPFWDLEDGLDYPARRLKVRDLKFTELIIQECASICEINGQSYKHSFTPAKARLAESTSNHCAKMIKHHFGVEE
jgi:hypothetical protein